MTILKNSVVLLFLLSILALGSIGLGHISVSEARSNTASAGRAKNTPAVNVNRAENTAVSVVPKKQDSTARPDFIDRETMRVWRRIASATGLPGLERSKLSPDDIEIRVWHIPGLYIVNAKCWSFSRKAGRWTAVSFVDQDFKGKIIKKILDASPAGLERWDAYVGRDLTPARIRGPLPEPEYGSEGMGVILEVKFGKDYARQLLSVNNDLVADLFKTIKPVFFNNENASTGSADGSSQRLCRSLMSEFTSSALRTLARSIRPRSPRRL